MMADDDDDDDACTVTYIEIVPLDKFNDCSDVKCEPDSVKVRDVFSVYFIHLCKCLVHQFTSSCVVVVDVDTMWLLRMLYSFVLLPRCIVCNAVFPMSVCPSVCLSNA